MDQSNYMKKSTRDLEGVLSPRLLLTALLNQKATEAEWGNLSKASHLGNFLSSHVVRRGLPDPNPFFFWKRHAALHLKTHTHTCENMTHLTHLPCLVSHLQTFISISGFASKLSRNNMQSHYYLCVTNTFKASTCAGRVIISRQNVENKFIYIWKELTPTNNADSLTSVANVSATSRKCNSVKPLGERY